MHYMVEKVQSTVEATHVVESKYTTIRSKHSTAKASTSKDSTVESKLMIENMYSTGRT